MAAAPAFYSITIHPTYLHFQPIYMGGKSARSQAFIDNQKNLENNIQDGEMSKKARHRISNSINWMVLSAKSKRVWSKKAAKHFRFKVNFITLTLPVSQGNYSDKWIKKELFHAWMQYARVTWGVRNYIWKAETQDNGNIHFHITTDVFIHHKLLRHSWNRLLEKKGVMAGYISKHKAMSFEQYDTRYNPKDEYSPVGMLKRYVKGQNEGWSNPNSTDVRCVINVKNLAGYLAKYLAKDNPYRRRISGRLWGCNFELSEKRKVVYESAGVSDKELMWIEKNKAFKEIECEFGHLYVIKSSELRKELPEGMSKLVEDRIFEIQNDVEMAPAITHILD